MTRAIALAVILAVVATPASAQNGAKLRDDQQRAGDVATQPLSDLNVRKRTVPPLLAAIQDRPYALDGLRSCPALRRAIGDLDSVLGPDVDVPASKRTAEATAFDVAGDIVGGIIPFRGLVREATGAKAADRRFNRAIYAGVARRSFLKGVASGRGCR